MGDQLFISIPYCPVRRIPSPVGQCVMEVIYPSLEFKSSTGHSYEALRLSAFSGFVCEPQFTVHTVLPLCFLHTGTLVMFQLLFTPCFPLTYTAFTLLWLLRKDAVLFFFLPLFIQYYSPSAFQMIHPWVNVPKFPNKIPCLSFFRVIDLYSFV